MPSQMADTSRTVDRIIKHRGVAVPTFLYGTAWKEDRTEALTHLALSSGFLGIDTANQRRHYDEAAVGKAVRVRTSLAMADGMASKVWAAEAGAICSNTLAASWRGIAPNAAPASLLFNRASVRAAESGWAAR